jgi:hypothetical protein
VLLLILAGLGVLVTEDKVNLAAVSGSSTRKLQAISYLVGSAALVRSEHDNVRGGVRELLLVKSLVILQELHVSSTALQTICKSISIHWLRAKSVEHTLELDFVLHNKGVALVVNGLGELGRDGVMSGLVLNDQTLIALHTLQHGGLLYSPVADISPLLLSRLVILLCVRSLPSTLPIVRELL